MSGKMSKAPAQVPEWLLDYNNCSIEELRCFVQDRTGAAVNEKDLLTAHLRKMDQAVTFPRFMELPPELRVSVYEYLLVDDRARDIKGWLINNDDCKLYTAVLRTSKQVYAEAKPILYNQNPFTVMIGYTWEGSRPAGDEVCGLRIVQPGHKFSFHSRVLYLGCDHPGWRNFWSHGPPVNMLQALKHLTIDLGLITPQRPPHEFFLSYTAQAREAVTAVLLVFIGDCKLESLTIKIDLEDDGAGDATDLAEILWPLILLRTEVVVRVEGISANLQTLANHEERARQRALLSSQTRATFASTIVQIKALRKKEPWSRENDKMIVKLNALGYWVDMADIVNLTAKWKHLHSHVDALETF